MLENTIEYLNDQLNDLSGLAGSVADFALNNKSFMIHSTLDVLGMLPGIGNFADGLNAVVYLLEGDMTNVAWSLAACLPLAGVAAVGVKYTGKAADATITFFKNSDKLNGFLDKGKDLLKGGDNFFSKLFKKADDVPVEDIPRNSSANVPKSLLQGEANTRVYLGIKDGEFDYVGIAKDIGKRQKQHGDRFETLREITEEPLTRRQARAIEQVMIEKHPEFSNKINSISPNRDWYNDAKDWGTSWLEEHGFL